jgi:hypothetical protein
MPRDSSIAVQLGAAALGLGYALVIVFLTVFIVEGGHGWNSSVISWLGVVLVPAGAVAWARNSRRGAVAVVALAFAVDVLMVVAALQEGLQYVQRAWNVALPFVVVWLGLWIGWQLFLLAVVGD